MAAFVLPFEKPVVDLIEKVRELRALAASDARFEPELARLEEKTNRLARELFSDLSPMQKVQLSRHANRPYTLDYVKKTKTTLHSAVTLDPAITNIFVASDAGSTPSLGLERLAVTLGGTTPTAHVKIHVTGRDAGS